MNLNQAKSQLNRFLGLPEVTFSIKHYASGEWTAECNEIPSIITGGMGWDISTVDKMIRDAILTAAGIPNEYADKLLRFVGLSSPFFDIITGGNSPKKAEYVLAE